MPSARPSRSPRAERGAFAIPSGRVAVSERDEPRRRLRPFPSAHSGQTTPSDLRRFASEPRGYLPTMLEPRRDDPAAKTAGIWSEAMWSAGLVGAVMLLTLLASVLGRT